MPRSVKARKVNVDTDEAEDEGEPVEFFKIMASNHMPDYLDSEGQISRRLVAFNLVSPVALNDCSSHLPKQPKTAPNSPKSTFNLHMPCMPCMHAGRTRKSIGLTRRSYDGLLIRSSSRRLQRGQPQLNIVTSKAALQRSIYNYLGFQQMYTAEVMEVELEKV